MATSGTILGTTSNEYINSRITWTCTQSVSTNSSTITATLYYKRNNTGYTTYGTGSFSINIAGQAEEISKVITITDKWVEAIKVTKTVSHNVDGTKHISISAEGRISGTSLISTTCVGSVTLDTIPRASTIINASNKTLGTACTVKWIPYATSFRYKLKFTLKIGRAHV